MLDGLPASSKLTHTEIFGPVLSLVHADSIDEAMNFLHNSPYGNQASLFTTNGAAARKFRYEAPAGNIGINIGVAAPMAYFPFSGWKESFFGILHGQGKDAVEFYTESKIGDRAVVPARNEEILRRRRASESRDKPLAVDAPLDLDVNRADRVRAHAGVKVLH